MIMASLLDLGTDLRAICRAVRRAVESVGCRLEKRSIKGLPGDSDFRQAIPFRRGRSQFSIPPARTGKALKNALCDLHILIEPESWARSVVQVLLVIAALET